MSVAHVVLVVMAALVSGFALATLYAEFMPVIRRRLSETRELMQAGDASLSRCSMLAPDRRPDNSPRGPSGWEYPLALYGSWRGSVHACDNRLGIHQPLTRGEVGNHGWVRPRHGVRRVSSGWPRFLRECRQNSKRPRRGIG